jgi:hypothetical protein
MNSRDEFAIKTLRYLDEDLGGQELVACRSEFVSADAAKRV